MVEDRQNRLSPILASLLKPLTFAAKDNFHHIESVKGIEPLIDALCRKALACDCPDETVKRFESLRVHFKGYDLLDRGVKEARIKAALEIVRGIERVSSAVSLTASLDQVRRALDLLMTPLGEVRGIGARLAGRLKKKGFTTVEDMLYFFPLRYEDRRHIRKISALGIGKREVVIAEILALGEIYYGRRRVFEIAVGDQSGIVKAKWFHYRLPYMKRRYKAGQRLLLFGEVTSYGGQKEIIHPDVEIIEKGKDDPSEMEGIIPVYSQIDNLHQKTIRKIVQGIVNEYVDYAAGGTPRETLRKHRLMELPDAIRRMHSPDESDSFEGETWLPRRSVVFDEFFCLEVGLALRKAGVERERGIAFRTDSKLAGKFLKQLPFTLTGAQERVVGEIGHDMASPHPMNRLIQGDVGSGKTVVALIAAITAIDNGYQAAMMVPTEILAEQHYLTSRSYLEPLNIKAALLTSALTKGEKDALAEDIGSGAVNLVIGTHAIIQEYVDFKNLGLAIIDEQHRFGVIQRASLKRKGINPDIIVMTATPIPRTLSMTVFGDLNISTIDELPPDRQEIKTRIYKDKGREAVYDLIRGELRKGRQAYVVYPLVEESEEVDLRDATTMQEHLERDVFSDFSVGLLHGRMKGEEKESVMRVFKKGELDLLVATTVIEVGIDVPNATVMLIEHAERFGLAQLHQLRGRVGRGGERSHCLLLAAGRVSDVAYRRLKVMESTSSGFILAEEDLRLRGPGDFIGKRQSGLPDFRTANPLDDIAILQQARDEAFKVVGDDPSLSLSNHLVIREVVRARWRGRLELAMVG
ncbi:MAG: ATP-dependent DNA helicase RecG [Deltaproteobacteria bacterium]|nr:ATP-dependent DNA helicase RecG [Deltaproteobacteria bacterium]